MKRKKIYEGCHKKEYVDSSKIFKVLNYLKESGHPYYQFFDDIKSYEERCKTHDVKGHQLIFEENTFQNKSDTDSEQIDNDCEEEENSDKEEDINKLLTDDIRKHQFDHNRNSCLVNNYPEIYLDENGRRTTANEEFIFAPAEGNHPTNLLYEKDWDIKSWPALYPSGKFGISYKREIRLTDQQYFIQIILNKDTRFANSPGFIFTAAAYIEQKQLTDKANISYRRGKKSKDSEGITYYDLNDGFTIFDGVRNTPKYWQKVKYDMIAKLENLGPFHIFFTLSCRDARCDENFSSFLVEQGYTLNYYVRDDGTTETKVVKKDGKTINKKLNQFLKEDISESLHEMIGTNVLTATRNFQHRVNSFRKHIMMGKNNPMNVKYISQRVEFQGRGAAHIHGTLWLDIPKIEKSDIFSEQSEKTEETDEVLSEGFKKLHDDLPLNGQEINAIVRLTDMFITCSLYPYLGYEKVVEIAKSVNVHHCTRSCKKYDDKCRFSFPKFPLKETIIIDKHEVMEYKNRMNQNNNHNSEYDDKYFNKIISDVSQALNDENVVREITAKYPKGETEEQYHSFRSKRIDYLLEKTGIKSYEDYIMAIKVTRKHGSTVLLKRDVDEIFVNNYNREWLNTWNANLDIQPVLDYFAVITYVTDYWAKPDEGITPILKEAAENLKSQPDQKKKCQQMANTFITHRQMGEAEAYYKIFPNLTLKYSNVDTIFMPSDKKELRSTLLIKLN